MTKPLALIIEDDPQLCQIFSLALHGDYATEAINDGRAALTRLDQVVPALVLLDMHLPSIPGGVLFARIRADDRLASTKVIICTADAHQAEDYRESADLVLLKPVSPLQLRTLAARFRPDSLTPGPV